MVAENRLPLVRGPAVFLVHGTFAVNAAWTANDSLLAHAIRHELPFAWFPDYVGWDGKNSHSARQVAADALTAAIQEACKSGDGTFFAIGHSHGGNVILKALGNDQISDRCRGVAFLGTPFIQVTKRITGELIEQFSPIAVTIIGILIFISVMAIPYMFMGHEEGPFVSILSLIILAPVYWVGFYFFQRSLKRALMWRLEAAGNELSELASLHPPPCPTFVASTRKDEAALGLGIADRVAARPWWLVGRLVAGTGSLVGALGVCVLLSAAFGWSDEGLAPMMLSLFVALFVFGGGLLVLPAAYVIGKIRGLSFGGEGPFASLAVRVMPSGAPPWVDLPGSERMLTDPPGPWCGKLRHSSFYADPEVARRLASWIAARMGAATSTSAGRAEHLSALNDSIPRGWYNWPGLLAAILFLIVTLIESFLA